MNKNGPIVVIEDDVDDADLLRSIFGEIGCTNELRFFSDPKTALEYLKLDDSYPFLVISDINMPRLNGFELKHIIQEDVKLRAKCVPYIFLSTAVEPPAVHEAYSISVQGIFKKPVEYSKLRDTISLILQYWSVSITPSPAFLKMLE